MYFMPYSIPHSKQGHGISPEHPDTHSSTEPAWQRCLQGPWGAPAHRGTPNQTKEIRERLHIPNNPQQLTTGNNGSANKWK